MPFHAEASIFQSAAPT